MILKLCIIMLEALFLNWMNFIFNALADNQILSALLRHGWMVQYLIKNSHYLATRYTDGTETGIVVVLLSMYTPL